MDLQTIAEVLAWYESQAVATSPKATRERRRLWSSFCAKFGEASIEAARPADLLCFIQAQPGIRSNWTRRRVKATIQRPFNAACGLGLITRNPFRGLTFPEGPDGRDWTDHEYKRIVENATPAFRQFVIFCRFAGARPGEARKITWADIRSGVGVLANHKTSHSSKSPRRIYFNRVTLSLLEQLPTRTGCLFLNSHGRPWTTRALTKNLAAIRRRCGLAPDVKLHGARHTFATRGLMNGVDLKTIAELLGHASVKTAERYLHLVDKRDYLLAAAEKAASG